MSMIKSLRRFGGKAARKLFPKTMDFRRIVSEHNWEIDQCIRLTSATREEQLERDLAMYEKLMDQTCNIEDPKRFSEKIQWRKFFDQDPVYSFLSDKYAVRKWVAGKVGEEHLIPLLGVWSSEKEIRFDQLPKDYVLKTNNGYATNLFVSGNKVDPKMTREMFRYWLNLPFWIKKCEMHYRIIPSKIIAEQYMKTEKGLDDYKFHCFQGKPKFCEVHSGRFTPGQHKCAEYDMEWNRMDWVIDSKKPELFMDKPDSFDKLYDIAAKLCEGFEYVRVDLYDIDGRIYFGEMTFTDSSGMCKFYPDNTDEMLGGLWNINALQADYSKIGLTPEEVLKEYAVNDPSDLWYAGKKTQA